MDFIDFRDLLLFTYGYMSTRILDISSLKIHVPILADEASLRRQFVGQTAGNNEDLDKAYELLVSPTAQPVNIQMVLVETEALVGSLPQEIIAASCDALRISRGALMRPSLAQIGSITSLFRDEPDVQRAVPILEKEKSVCLIWTRTSWPSGKRPVFRFHDGIPIHSTLWMMLPVVGE